MNKLKELQYYKDALKDLDITPKEMASKIGLSYGSYRSAVMPSNKSIPKWVKSFNIAYRRYEKD